EGGVGDVAHRGAVDVDVAGLDRTHDLGAVLVQVHDHAVLGDDDAVVGHAGLLGQLGVGTHVAPLAVHRHEIARTHHVEDVQQLAGGGVARHVYQGVALVHDVGAPAGEAVDDPVDGVLVARDQRRGEQDGVALLDADLVVAAGHAAQCRHGLALRPGADQHGLVRPHLVELLDVDDGVAGDTEVPQVPGDVHVSHHRAAHEGDLAPVL